MSSVEDTPCHELFADGSLDLDSLERRNVMMLAVANIVEQLVDISFGEEQPAKKKHQTRRSEPTNEEEDKVHAYACGILTHGYCQGHALEE